MEEADVTESSLDALLEAWETMWWPFIKSHGLVPTGARLEAFRISSADRNDGKTWREWQREARLVRGIKGRALRNHIPWVPKMQTVRQWRGWLWGTFLSPLEFVMDG